MVTPGFPPPPQSLRKPTSTQPGASAFGPIAPADRDTMRSIPNGSFAHPPTSPVRAVIRRLPLNTSEESLRLMVVWSKELLSVELLPAAQSDDDGFLSAILEFRSINGALEAKNMLDGAPNISNQAAMAVHILGDSPSANTDSYPDDFGPESPGSLPPSTIGSGRPSAVNPPPMPMHHMPGMPQHPAMFGAQPSDLGGPHGPMGYHNAYSLNSPIGSHLRDRTRISGKSLIENNLTDDDDTTVLLNDPVAYAESRPSAGRRATAPQIPISRMNNLSLNTATTAPASASVPTPYMNPLSAHPMGPGANGINGGPPGGPGAGRYPMSTGYRSNFPPINPADQNPPCNTLYVGNLPVGTNEDELKVMFSKQRGYKRLCFRTKHNGPMCFVEFEDVTFATKALHELYGHPLHNSIKGGIRLSFSKNPLGVRSQHNTNANAHPAGPMGPGPMNGVGAPGGPLNGAMNGLLGGPGGVMNGAPANGYGAANRPPPGLGAPPGLEQQGQQGQNQQGQQGQGQGQQGQNRLNYGMPPPNGNPGFGPPGW